MFYCPHFVFKQNKSPNERKNIFHDLQLLFVFSDVRNVTYEMTKNLLLKLCLFVCLLWTVSRDFLPLLFALDSVMDPYEQV